MAAFNTPVAADNQNVTVGAHIRDLLFNHIPLVQINHAVFTAGRRWQAVGHLRIRKIADGNAVYCLVHIVIIGFQIIKPHGHHIIRHSRPVCHRRGNAASAFIIAVVVGKAEHPEANIIQRIGNIPRRREHRVTGRFIIIIDQRFLVEPVHIKPGVKIPQIFIGRDKVIVAITAARPGLVVNALVDQVIPGCRKVYCLYDRFRFRCWRGRLCRFCLCLDFFGALCCAYRGFCTALTVPHGFYQQGTNQHTAHANCNYCARSSFMGP